MYNDVIKLKVIIHYPTSVIVPGGVEGFCAILV